MRLLFIILLLLPFTVFSQKKKTLNGYLGIEGGELFSYKIEFIEVEDKISGKATTWFETGKEVCAKMEGTIDRNNQILSFREKEILYNTGFASAKTICLINAQLKYQKDDNNNWVLSGRITSNDVSNVSCSRGFITFNNTFETTPLFEHANSNEKLTSSKPEIKSVKPYKEVTKNTTIPPEIKKPTAKPMRFVNDVSVTQPIIEKQKSSNNLPDRITVGQVKIYEWNSDSVSIEIWDNSRVDGDVISVKYNGKILFENYALIKEKKLLKLPLEKDENELTIIAINEGSEQPNTADIILYDGIIPHAVIAYNSIGKNSVIRFRKQKK